jgi:hypothetical protein
VLLELVVLDEVVELEELVLVELLDVGGGSAATSTAIV